MSNAPGASETVHGTCVAVDGKCVLLIGASGSGKSATALDLLSRGAVLIADDQVILTRTTDVVTATCPNGFEGKIEARGIGIVEVAHASGAPVVLVVDLDQTELQRLPPRRKHEILGLEIDLIYGRDNWLLGPGIVAVLRGARVD